MWYLRESRKQRFVQRLPCAAVLVQIILHALGRMRLAVCCHCGVRLLKPAPQMSTYKCSVVSVASGRVSGDDNGVVYYIRSYFNEN